MIKIKFPSIKTLNSVLFLFLSSNKLRPLSRHLQHSGNSFIIDFTAITCDLSLSQMLIAALPLSCTYTSTVLSCALSNPSDISSLSEQSYDIYNTSYLFHQISLINCTTPESKIDAVNGICLSSCGEQNKVDYNNECISECPSDTGNINGFCLDGFSD